MDIASLFLHNMRTEPCPGWVFTGSDWTDELKQQVSDLFKQFLDYEQFPSFNYWEVLTDGKGWIVASRFTWSDSWIGKDFEKLEADLKKYYSS